MRVMSTAYEVRAMQEQQRRIIGRQLGSFHDWQSGLISYTYAAYQLNGCVKLHNRSPKASARLRHSLTMLTLNGLPKISV
jgi:hypothetical protein